MAFKAAIADQIDPESLAEAFKANDRLHIPNFFETRFAKSVGDAMRGQVPWVRTMVVQGKGVEAPLQGMAANPQRAFELERHVEQTARVGFQYRYDTYRLSDQIEAGRRLGGPMEPIEQIYDFLNSEVFLEFVRKLTGDVRPAYCDAHASRYGPGHFLNGHHDGNAHSHRLFAYVLNFTPEWQTDWGGVLLFQDDARHVTAGYPPRFNALNIFKVPQWHSVSQVSSFAGAPRYSITGWVRSARPSAT